MDEYMIAYGVVTPPHQASRLLDKLIASGLGAEQDALFIQLASLMSGQTEAKAIEAPPVKQMPTSPQNTRVQFDAKSKNKSTIKPKPFAHLIALEDAIHESKATNKRAMPVPKSNDKQFEHIRGTCNGAN